MQKLRYFLALWASKAAIVALKVFKKNASTFPGAVAIKICPDFIRVSPKTEKTICVTGTNGKTTVTNMIASIFEKLGYRVATNAMGANVANGMATVLINSVNVFGKLRVDMQVFEMDERYSRLTQPAVNPDYLVVTNLTRDTIRRNAHPEYIFGILNDYTGKDTHVILNADDICSSMLVPQNKRTFYGIDRLESDVTEPYNLIADQCICPKCHTRLKFNYLRYHHIGNAYCPNCDFKSYDSDYLVEKIDEENNELVVSIRGERYVYPLVHAALFNVYNEIAVITLLKEFGIDNDKIVDVLGQTKIVDTRFRTKQAGNATVISTMAKGQNSVSVSRALDYVVNEPGNKSIVIIYDDYHDRFHSSELIGWIYDTDYEVMAREDVKQVVALGPRYMDQKLRLLMAGVPEDRILCAAEEFPTLDDMLTEGIDKVFVLYDTTTYDLSLPVTQRVVEVFGKAAKAN